MKRIIKNNKKNRTRYLCLTSEILENNRRAFQSMMKKDSERISLYSILMGNIMPYLIPARIKEVPLVKAF